MVCRIKGYGKKERERGGEGKDGGREGRKKRSYVVN